MFNDYYQDELNFLRELGREFAEAHPSAAHMLGAPGADPDVERLLEGAAFLTGRIRQKLDDEFPELTHAMMTLLYPHYLRSIPATTLIRFEPGLDALSGRLEIPSGATLESAPVEGTPCRFRTTAATALYPLILEDAVLEVPAKQASFLRLTFRLPEGMTPGQIGLTDLRLRFTGGSNEGYELYLLLCRHVSRWTASTGPDAAPVTLDPDRIQPIGFDPGEALWPYPPNSFQGYRLLQEYFTFPEKFLGVDLTGLGRLEKMETNGRLDLVFELDRKPDGGLRIGPDNVLMYTAPAVNLFEHEADPIRVQQERFEYPIRPSGHRPNHFDVFSIDRVTGYMPGTAEEKTYPPFYSFRHESKPGGAETVYYQVRLKDAASGHGVTPFVSFINVDRHGRVPPTEVISLDLTVSNGRLPEKLRPGDIKTTTEDLGPGVRFGQVGRVTRWTPPPLQKNVLWLLISHWSLGYLSLTDVESIRTLLGLYNFPAFYDRQAARENELLGQALVQSQARPEERFHRGRPVRGLHVTLTLKEDHFGGSGRMFLFGRVVHEFLARYATMNSFVRLDLVGAEQGETQSWPAQMGAQPLL